MVSVDMDVGSGRTTETLGLVCLFRRGLMFLFLVMILLSPAAQENLTPEAHRPEAGVALLARGPFTAKGLPFISTNVISYRGGIYLFDKGEVTIFFPRPGGAPFRCLGQCLLSDGRGLTARR